MTADDWSALSQLNDRAKRGLATATLAATQAAKLVRRGYVLAAARGSGFVLTPAGKAAIAGWQRSRRT